MGIPDPRSVLKSKERGEGEKADLPRMMGLGQQARKAATVRDMITISMSWQTDHMCSV